MGKIFTFIKKILTTCFKTKKRAGVSLVVIGFLIWFFVIRPGNSTTKQQIQTATVSRDTIVSTISASGQMLSSNIIPVTTSTGGLVKKVYVKDGDKVSNGQTIAEVTTDFSTAQKVSQAYSSYLSAKNSLFSAQNSLYTLQVASFAANQKFINDAVARSLATDDPTYIQENSTWLAAQANFDNQKNVIAAAQAALTNSWHAYQEVSPVVKATASGVITNITLVEGMNLTSTDAGTRIAIVRSTGTPLATFNVSEIDVSKVKQGMKATIKLDSIADRTFTGTIATVDRVGSVTSGVTNYPVIIKFDTDAEGVLPNMSATANIILDTKTDVLVVPSAAVQGSTGSYYVRVMKNGIMTQVGVETGLSSSSSIEITSGLSEGDEVVTTITSTTKTSGSSTSVFGSNIRVGGAAGGFTGARP